MKVLVIGKGGREHALVLAFASSKSVSEIHCLPGSDAIFSTAKKAQSDGTCLQYCQRNEIDLVVVGPEDPLVEGVADALRAGGVLVFGPSKSGARLEGSKIFAKEFMQRAGIPTARWHRVTSVQETMNAAKNFAAPYVLKADGLAAGKGVVICKSERELEEAADWMFVKETLGSAGAQAALEEFTPGWELSYHVLTNGEDFVALPIAQDHKRLHNGNTGPNTGGMGTIAPIAIDSELQIQIDERVVRPTLKELKRQGIDYRGVIFFGLMISPDGPSLLEFNCRFGDPETQVLLPVLDVDWGLALLEVAQGRLPNLPQPARSAVCVVLAAKGYPNASESGAILNLGKWGPKSDTEFSSKILIHSGTSRIQQRQSSLDVNQWQVSGGRVLGCVGVASSLQQARDLAYQLVNDVAWPDCQYRTDIGKSVETMD